MINAIDISSMFNIGSLFSFLTGVFFGLSIFLLIYVYMVIRSIGKKRYLVKVEEYDIDGKEIEMLVKETQDKFKDKKLKGEDGNFPYAMKLSANLAKDIACKFFPNSKYPLYEISIDETILLSEYITRRVEELLNHRGIKLLRKIKISTIISLTNAKKTVDENAIYKTTKKYKVKEKVKSAMGLLNIVNPVYWFKRVVMDTSMDLIIKKICIVIIGIVGEETFKIYSKRVFNEERLIDTGVDEMIKELNGELEPPSDMKE